jgi:hypothetical protein
MRRKRKRNEIEIEDNNVRRKRKRNEIDDDDDDDDGYLIPPPSKKRRNDRNFNALVVMFDDEMKRIDHVHQDLTSKKEFKEGFSMLKEFLYFCLVLVSGTFPFSELQFTCFTKFIPLTLPLFFGETLFTSYKDNLHKYLGTIHNKLFFYFKGSRRDGKSILMSICGAGVFCTLNHKKRNYFFPFLGPGEGTGMRTNENIQTILNLDVVQNKYFSGNLNRNTLKPSQKKLEVHNDNKKCKKIGKALAPTAKALRGINSNLDLGDEGEFMEYDDWEKFLISRYKQSTLPAFWITTPNVESEEFRKFDESSNVVESYHVTRICNDCTSKKERGIYKTMNEAVLKCQELKHVQPPNAPWISEKLTSEWSKYVTDENFAAEHLGTIITNKLKQFNRASVDKLFEQIDYTPYNGYESFNMGCDPSDSGKSETAIWVMGYKNDVFHILYGNSYVVTHEQNVEDLIFMDILFFLEGVKKHIKKIPNTYIWIETFGSHGNRIHEKLHSHNLQQKVKVMKGIQITSKNPNDWKFGIPKGKKNSEEYVSTFKNLLNKNRLKIWKNFFTRNVKGNKYKLKELKTQMLNYIRDKNGKLTGKHGGKNDDNIIATMMIPDNYLKALNPLHNYNQQLNFDHEYMTF